MPSVTDGFASPLTPSLHREVLTLNVTVFGDRALGRYLGINEVINMGPSSHRIDLVTRKRSSGDYSLSSHVHRRKATKHYRLVLLTDSAGQ